MMKPQKLPARLTVCNKCVFTSDTILGTIIQSYKPCDRCGNSKLYTGAIIQLPMKLDSSPK